MADSLQYWMHQINYNYNYYKADFLRKYYNNSREPRVIQTKLSGKLLSLRMFPHNKYEIKPGEFLKLERPGRRVMSEPDLVTLKRENLIDISMEQESIPRLITSSCGCECHVGGIHSEDEMKFEYCEQKEIPSFDKPKEQEKKKQGFFRNFGFKKLTQISFIPSPPILENPIIDDKEEEKEDGEKSHDSPANNQILLFDNDESDLIEFTINDQKENIEESPIRPSSVDSAFIDQEKISNYRRRRMMLRKLSYDHNRGAPSLSLKEWNQPKHKEHGSEYTTNNVWKSVFNDVSLSAALISTGGYPVSHDEFPNLKADFRDAKSNKDVFSLSLEDDDSLDKLFSMYKHSK